MDLYWFGLIKVILYMYESCTAGLVNTHFLERTTNKTIVSVVLG